MTPTHSTKIFIGWTTMSWTTIIRIQFPLSRDILLNRDLIVGITIPSSISLPVSTLYSYRNTTFSVTNSLVTCLQALPNVHYRVGPEYISPKHGGTNPSLDSCNSTSTFWDTRKTPLWSPCHEAMVDVPKVFFQYPGITWSHGLRNRILDNKRHDNKNLMKRSILLCLVGSVHHVILLMTWSR